MKKTKTTAIFTIILILTLFFLTVFVFFVNVIKNKNKHISAVSKTLEEKIEKKNQLNLIKDQNDFILESNQKINSYFINSENIDIFIEYLESIGIQEKVELIVKGVEISKNDSKIISITFLAQGDFSNIFRIIQRIEYAPYKIHFKNLYLSKEIMPQTNKTKKETQILNWQLNGTLNILSSS